ncbi:MAG: serine hydrolase domain-containing protein [Rufibacter sp.]
MKKIPFYFLIAAGSWFISCGDKKEDPAPVTPPPVNPGETNAIAEIDNEVSAFMGRHNVPGVQVAVTKDGKLIYSKGYGLADKEASAIVDTTKLFRIASLSKPITAVAIMKLVEGNKLALNDKVFGPNGILGTQYGTQPYQSGITDITVKHLLQHTAGGWTNDNSDPMFTNPGLSAQELISWTLDNRGLNNAPGTAYAYSNFGYSILGRVIEKVSGKTYEEYVKTTILQPMGIKNMQIGGNTLNDRKTNEVKYYGQQGGNPYAYQIGRMDAHGGWIASANDLARFLVHVDGFSTKLDILTGQSTEIMTTPSAQRANYALGWMVNTAGNWWHSGALPGTVTFMARLANGYNWVILTNTRTTSTTMDADVEQIMWKTMNNSAVKWPSKDLF